MGVCKVLLEFLDFVLFGINCGQNFVEDVIYFGIVVGVMEGVILGIRLIVVLQVYNWDVWVEFDYMMVEVYVLDLFCKLVMFDLLVYILFNVNFLVWLVDQVKGVKVMVQGYYE